MLKVSGVGAGSSEGSTRRSFLRAGVLGVGGLTLPDLLRLRASGAASADRKSVILIWLSGGPGHMETWDPKPEASRADSEAPSARSPRACPGSTSVSSCPSRPGGWTGSRSSGRSTTGRATTPRATTGCSPATKGRPSTPPITRSSAGRRWARRSPGSEAPAVATGCRPTSPCPTSGAGRTTSSIIRGLPRRGRANPFIVESDPNDAKYRVKNLKLPEGAHARPPGRPPDASWRRWTGSAATADSKLRDLGRLRPERLRNAHRKATSPPPSTSTPRTPGVRDRYGRHTFGQSALLARRLVEAGTPFVTVNCVPWDHHGTKPHLKTEEGARTAHPPRWIGPSPPWSTT